MKYFSFFDAQKDKKDIPENEFFCVYDERPLSSAFVLTASETEFHCCFGIKVKGKVFMSPWFKERDEKQQMLQARNQMRNLQQKGWAKVKDGDPDDIFGDTPLFRCVYCYAETIRAEEPCICRQMALKMQK